MDKSGSLLTRQAISARSFHPLHHGGVKPLPAWFLFFGVALPLAALAYESTNHFCASHYFDPFPSNGHILLFALIPLSNFLTWLASRRDLSNHFAAMALVSGMALGVGVLYSLMFLPLTAASCFAVVFCGFGLLGLSPLLSLPCSWFAGKAVCRMAHAKATYFNPHQVEHVGHMVILVMVLAVELPSTLTRINLSRAAESNYSVSSSALEWLRKYGSVEVMQRACYERSGRATDILGSVYENAHPLSPLEARRIFYRVTGKPFNSVAIPEGARATIKRANVISDQSNLNAGVADEFDFDDAIAGESVAGVARGLSAAKNKVDCAIDADVALATVNMSFDLVNASKIDREARAILALPPDAVITAAYLDVDGKKYAADIETRNAAREQYRENVQARKAPLLVSMVGSGSAMLQCYPVRPGHPLSVTLGMAVPLTVLPDGKARLTLPALAEQNFAISEPFKIVSNSTSQTLASPETLSKFGADIIVARNAEVTLARCNIDHYITNSVVDRILKPVQYRSIKKIDVIVDTSAPMQAYIPAIYKGLASLPPGLAVNVELIKDKIEEHDFNFAMTALRKLTAAGGQDDSHAVVDAVERAAGGRDGTVVLWIHGFQPEGVDTEARKRLKSLLGASYLRPLLFDFPVIASSNPLLAGVYAPHGLSHVPRSSDIGRDLADFFRSCVSIGSKTDDSTAAAVASALDLPVMQTLTADEYTSHPREPEKADSNVSNLPKPESVGNCDERLAQIWANRLIGYDQDAPNAPVDDARLTSWHIVSPISSAIISQTISPEVSTKTEAVKERWDFNLNGYSGRLSALQKGLSRDSKAAVAPQTADQGDHDLLGRKVDAMYESGAPSAAPSAVDSERSGQTNAARSLDAFNTLGGSQTISGANSVPISAAKNLRLDAGDPRYHPPHQTSTRPRNDIALVFVIVAILLGTLVYALRNHLSKRR